MNPRLIVQPLVGVVLIGCALFVLWQDRKKKTIEVKAEVVKVEQPKKDPPADLPDPNRKGADA